VNVAGLARNGAVRSALLDGFGASRSGEDPFDAIVVGLTSMIEVVDGRRHEMSVPADAAATWEAWILGQ
jgi:hypothetical protein